MFLNILGIEMWSRLSMNDLNVQSIDFSNGQESSRARIALITSIRRVSNKSRGRENLVREDFAKRHCGVSAKGDNKGAGVV